MHELGIAEAILRACRTRMPSTGGRLVRVRVAIGELSAIEPELLRYAFQAAVAGGPHSGAALEVDWRPARERCSACGRMAARAAGEWRERCPACGGPLQVEGGQELDLLDFAIEPHSAGVSP